MLMAIGYRLLLMFPNSYFPTTYFTPGYFTILATIIILPEFRSVDGTSTKVKIDEVEVTVVTDDDEVLELITMMFNMGLFNG